MIELLVLLEMPQINGFGRNLWGWKILLNVKHD